MGAKNCKIEQPELPPNKRFWEGHDLVDEMESSERVDEACFLGGRRFLGLKPIQSPLSPMSKSCHTRTSGATALTSDSASIHSDDTTDSLRSSASLSERGDVQQVSEDDRQMTPFLNEVFHADNAAMEKHTIPFAMPLRRRQRIHEINHLSPNEVCWGDEDASEYRSSPEVLSSRKRSPSADSMSDSEVSTPCTSPVSLHGAKDLKQKQTGECIHEDVTLSLPLSQTSYLSPDAESVTSSLAGDAFFWLEPPELVSNTAATGGGFETERMRLSNLGDQLERQGKLEEALRCYELVYDHDERLCTGLDDSALVHLKIGVIYWKMSNYCSCLDALNYVLSMYEEELGPDWLEQSHSFLITATALTVSEVFLMLSRAHLSLGEIEQSRGDAKLCLSILSIANVDHDRKQPILARGLQSLGMTYEADGRYTKALKNYNEALSIQKQVLGDDHFDVAAAIASIGSVKEKSGNLGEAMNCFTDALSIYETKTGIENCQVDIGSLLLRIGWICYVQGHDAAAMEAYQEAVQNFLEVLGLRHRNVASAKVQIGLLHQSQGHSEEALAFYKSALECQKQTLGDIHDDVAITLDAMAISYESLEMPEEAIATLDQVLQVRRELLGSRHIDVGNTFASLGRLYTQTKSRKLAKQCLGNAVKILRANLPANDKRLLDVTESLREIVRMSHLRR